MDGQVLLNGHDLRRIGESDMNKVRWKQISMVFQGAMNALNPVRTVESQIVEYAPSDSIFNCSKHPYTQRLLKAFPDIEKPGAELVWIPGSPPRLDALPTGCRFQPRYHLAEEICRNETPVLTFNPPDHGFACHVIQRRTE